MGARAVKTKTGTTTRTGMTKTEEGEELAAVPQATLTPTTQRARTVTKDDTETSRRTTTKVLLLQRLARVLLLPQTPMLVATIQLITKRARRARQDPMVANPSRLTTCRSIATRGKEATTSRRSKARKVVAHQGATSQPNLSMWSNSLRTRVEAAKTRRSRIAKGRRCSIKRSITRGKRTIKGTITTTIASRFQLLKHR